MYKSKFIWIVIPAFNESENLQRLIPEIIHNMVQISDSYNVLIVDDGSTDSTQRALSAIKETSDKLKVLTLRNNLGKAAALKLGFEFALENDAQSIIMMDADGQDSPLEIKKLLDEFEKGFNLVTGARLTRKDRFIKRNTSKIYNLVTKLVTKTPGNDFNSGFKIMDRETATEISQMLYGELHRYITVIAFWSGFKIAEIEVIHQSRMFGKSKYGLARFWRGLIDLITIRFLMSYKNRPSHLFGGVGFLSAFSGSLLMLYLLYLRLLGETIGGRPLLILSVLLILVGLQLILFGLLAELVVFSQKKRKNS